MQSVQADAIFNDLTGDGEVLGGLDTVTEVAEIDTGRVSNLYSDLLDYLTENAPNCP